MLISLNYCDIQNTENKLVSVGVENKGKVTSTYVRMTVIEDTILDAVSLYDSSSFVLLFDMSVDVSLWPELKAKLSGLRSHKVLLHLPEMPIDKAIEYAHDLPNLRFVLPLDSDFCDMQIISKTSRECVNLYFCGGNLIRLRGCNIGCLTPELTPRHKTTSLVSVNGCSCTMPVMTVTGAELHFNYKPVTYSTKSVGKSNDMKIRKKAGVTVPGMFHDAGLSNF